MRTHNSHKLTAIETPIAKLKRYPGNARQHSRKQINKLADLIAAHGFINPIIVDETGMILAGHARYEAAQKVGLETVPVRVVDWLSEAQKRSYILSDNRLADESSFSKVQLRRELQGLIELGDNLELTGFDSLEIDTMLSIGEDEPVDGDDNVELPDDRVAPVSRVGDLWHIGEHRALCGDARDLANCERLLDGERAQLIFTDPPYGCRIANNVSGLGKTKHDDFVMGAGEQALPEFAHSILRPAFKCMAASAASGAIAFICTDWRAYPHMLDAAQGIFLEQKNLIVWAKTNSGMGQFYRSAHELVLAMKVSAGPHINNFGLGGGGRHRSNVWTYAGANTFRRGRMEDLEAHSTVKPKKLVADAIVDCSKRGGIVLDSFLGSGTTLVSCAMTGRRGRGLELDPKYMDVILRRVEAETGCEPLLDGVTPFSEVAIARRGEER